MKKRSKKLLSVAGSILISGLNWMLAAIAKVFCFFFSKKKDLPGLHAGIAVGVPVAGVALVMRNDTAGYFVHVDKFMSYTSPLLAMTRRVGITAVRHHRAPLGHSTTRSVCNMISISNRMEKFFT